MLDLFKDEVIRLELYTNWIWGVNSVAAVLFLRKKQEGFGHGGGVVPVRRKDGQRFLLGVEWDEGAALQEARLWKVLLEIK